MRTIRLGVNIDHVGTVRNARGGSDPDPVRAALLAVAAGADGITLHLREDRRHIRDDDLQRLRKVLQAPINLEIAATAEMLEIALSTLPHAVCLVPERRAEVTTEGGLDAAGQQASLQPIIGRLNRAGIRVSLFIDPDEVQVRAAAGLGAAVVELHTGSYAAASLQGRAVEWERLRHAASVTSALGLECHAGHGLNFENVGQVAAIEQVVELNIGHFLVGEAMFIGLANSIAEMKRRIAAGSQGSALA